MQQVSHPKPPPPTRGPPPQGGTPARPRPPQGPTRGPPPSPGRPLQRPPNDERSPLPPAQGFPQSKGAPPQRQGATPQQQNRPQSQPHSQPQARSQPQTQTQSQSQIQSQSQFHPQHPAIDRPGPAPAGSPGHPPSRHPPGVNQGRAPERMARPHQASQGNPRGPPMSQSTGNGVHHQPPPPSISPSPATPSATRPQLPPPRTDQPQAPVQSAPRTRSPPGPLCRCTPPLATVAYRCNVPPNVGRRYYGCANPKGGCGFMDFSLAEPGDSSGGDKGLPAPGVKRPAPVGETSSRGATTGQTGPEPQRKRARTDPEVGQGGLGDGAATFSTGDGGADGYGGEDDAIFADIDLDAITASRGIAGRNPAPETGRGGANVGRGQPTSGGGNGNGNRNGDGGGNANGNGNGNGNGRGRVFPQVDSGRGGMPPPHRAPSTRPTSAHTTEYIDEETGQVVSDQMDDDTIVVRPPSRSSSSMAPRLPPASSSPRAGTHATQQRGPAQQQGHQYPGRGAPVAQPRGQSHQPQSYSQGRPGGRPPSSSPQSGGGSDFRAGGPPYPGPASLNPPCKCGDEAVVRTAGPKAKNPGRQFYACPRPRGEQCEGFIGWVDEYVEKDPRGPYAKELANNRNLYRQGARTLPAGDRIDVATMKPMAFRENRRRQCMTLLAAMAKERGFSFTETPGYGKNYIHVDAIIHAGDNREYEQRIHVEPRERLPQIPHSAASSLVWKPPPDLLRVQMHGPDPEDSGWLFGGWENDPLEVQSDVVVFELRDSFVFVDRKALCRAVKLKFPEGGEESDLKAHGFKKRVRVAPNLGSPHEVYVLMKAEKLKRQDARRAREKEKEREKEREKDSKMENERDEDRDDNRRPGSEGAREGRTQPFRCDDSGGGGGGGGGGVEAEGEGTREDGLHHRRRTESVAEAALRKAMLVHERVVIDVWPILPEHRTILPRDEPYPKPVPSGDDMTEEQHEMVRAMWSLQGANQPSQAKVGRTSDRQDEGESAAGQDKEVPSTRDAMALDGAEDVSAGTPFSAGTEGETRHDDGRSPDQGAMDVLEGERTSDVGGMARGHGGAQTPMAEMGELCNADTLGIHGDVMLDGGNATKAGLDGCEDETVEEVAPDNAPERAKPVPLAVDENSGNREAVPSGGAEDEAGESAPGFEQGEEAQGGGEEVDQLPDVKNLGHEAADVEAEAVEAEAESGHRDREEDEGEGQPPRSDVIQSHADDEGHGNGEGYDEGDEEETEVPRRSGGGNSVTTSSRSVGGSNAGRPSVRERAAASKGRSAAKGRGKQGGAKTSASTSKGGRTSKVQTPRKRRQDAEEYVDSSSTSSSEY